MDTEQFKKDILPFQNKLYRYALSIVLEIDLAKDIVQEVFLKVWTKRAELKDVVNKEAWCVRITRNLALDKLKAANRKNVDLKYAANHFVGDANPATQLEEQDLTASIYEAMKDLSPQQKEIFRLRDLLGYSNKEIKELMDLKDSQVKVNLFRARQKIKAKLGKLINYGS